jgi:hypothetical protein
MKIAGGGARVARGTVWRLHWWGRRFRLPVASAPRAARLAGGSACPTPGRKAAAAALRGWEIAA